jgi:hypothetical protein
MEKGDDMSALPANSSLVATGFTVCKLMHPAHDVGLSQPLSTKWVAFINPLLQLGEINRELSYAVQRTLRLCHQR